ncbi:MAG: cyclic nucleotide-binding domain-containing protein [Cyclonatronaceae bacterium]
MFNSLIRQGQLVFNSPLLSKLSHVEAYEFIQLCHKRRYKDGEYIYHQRDPGNGFYFIESGHVELIIENEEGEQIGPALVVEPPLSFGNLSLIHDMKRVSCARAVGDIVVLGFFSPDFDTLAKRNPQIAVKVLSEINRTLARQLTATQEALKQKTSEAETNRLQFETFYTEEQNNSML